MGLVDRLLGQEPNDQQQNRDDERLDADSADDSVDDSPESDSDSNSGDNQMSDSEENAEMTDDSDVNTDSDERESSIDSELKGLDVRISDVENSVQQTQASVDAIQSGQEQITDDVEDINDSVRQLLGVYDQVAADSNPFEANSDDFGVVEEPGSGNSTPSVEGSANAGSESMVTFEDIHDEETPGEHNEEDHGGEQHDAHTDDSDVETDTELSGDTEQLESDEPSEPPEDEDGADHSSLDEPQVGVASDSAVSPENSADSVEDAQSEALTSIKGGYASELVVMEWLMTLIEESGPASTLKALDYYEDTNWISSGAREEIETYLSGPNLDVHIDPTEPDQLTAQEHVMSERYIRLLEQVSEES